MTVISIQVKGCPLEEQDVNENERPQPGGASLAKATLAASFLQIVGRALGIETPRRAPLAPSTKGETDDTETDETR
jgi:hypothetical protein